MNQSFHTPVHPLPDEIQSMKEDDTVCKFCGISYLIHREVKRLQDELDSCQKKLISLENAATREEKAKAEIELWKEKFNELSQSASKTRDDYENLQQEKEMILLSMKNIDGDNRSLKHELIEKKELVNQLNYKIKGRDSSIKSCKSSLIDIRRSFGIIKETSTGLKEKFGSKLTDLRYYVSEISEKNARKMQKLTEELNYNNENHLKVDELLNNKDQKISQLNSSNDELKKDLQDHMTAVKKLLKDNTLLKGKNCKLNEIVDKTNMELKNLQDDFADQKSRLSNEISSLKEYCSQLSREISSKSSAVSELKAYNDKLLNENSSLKNFRSNAEKDSSNFNDELKAATLTSKIASEELKRLKSQRQLDIEMHHEQLKEMRESYKTKLIDASDELKEMKEQHENEMSTIEKSFKNQIEVLKKSNEKTIDKQKQVYNESLRLATIEVNKKLNQITSERDSIEKNILKERQGLQNSFESEQRKLNELCLQHENEINELKSKLSLIEKEKIYNQDLKSNLSRKKFEESNRALELANDEISRLQKIKLALESKMEQLQETVRKECEERLELTQSLCDARMEFLELQRKQQLPVNDSRSSYSGTTSHSSSSTKSPRKLSRPQKPKGFSYTDIKKRLSPP